MLYVTHARKKKTRRRPLALRAFLSGERRAVRGRIEHAKNPKTAVNRRGSGRTSKDGREGAQRSKTCVVAAWPSSHRPPLDFVCFISFFKMNSCGPPLGCLLSFFSFFTFLAQTKQTPTGITRTELRRYPETCERTPAQSEQTTQIECPRLRQQSSSREARQGTRIGVY